MDHNSRKQQAQYYAQATEIDKIRPEVDQALKKNKRFCPNKNNKVFGFQTCHCWSKVIGCHIASSDKPFAGKTRSRPPQLS